MKISVLKKNVSIIIVLLLVLVSISVSAEKSLVDIDKENNISIEKYINKNVKNNDLKVEVTSVLNNNSSGRYLTLSLGIRASSYFVKLPRFFTQRGMVFFVEIWYRSNFALTLVFQKNNSRLRLVNFERGTHRLTIFGIGHSTFSRPHCFSFGRLTAYTSIQPIIF